MIIKSEQSTKETLPAVEEKAEDIYQDGAAWDIEEEETVFQLVGHPYAKPTGPC